MVHRQFGEMLPVLEVSVFDGDDHDRIVEVFKNRVAVHCQGSKAEPFWKRWLHTADLRLEDVRDPDTFVSYLNLQDIPRTEGVEFAVEGFICDHAHD